MHPKTVHPEPRPYSHAFVVDTKSFSKLVFISGQLGIDERGNVVEEPGDFRAQFIQTYKNLQNTVEAAGGTMENIVQLRTFLTNRSDLDTFNKVRSEQYATLFPNGNYPPNTLLIIDALFRPDVLLEIEAIAAI